jgi:hypothetical protein
MDHSNAEDERAFSLGMARLSEVFRREVSELIMDSYWRVLSDLDAAEFTMAVDKALSQCDRFPVPAELRAFSGRKRKRDPYIQQLLIEGRKRVPRQPLARSSLPGGAAPTPMPRSLSEREMGRRRNALLEQLAQLEGER